MDQYKQLLMTRAVTVLNSLSGKECGSQHLAALHVALHTVGGGAGDDLHPELGDGASLWSEDGNHVIARHGDRVQRGDGGDK